MFGSKKKKLEAMTPEEAYREATIQKKRKDYLFYCLYAAEHGHMEAQYQLGWHYERKKDPKQALYWYEKAAEQGHRWAQSNCGNYYKKGTGCTADPEKSVYWYSKAAEQGHSFAMHDLGDAYETGAGCEQDYEKAMYWYEKSAEAGNEYAAFLCIKRYEKGTICPKDLQKVLHYNELLRDLYKKELDENRRKGLTSSMATQLDRIEQAQEEINRTREKLGMGPEPAPELKPKKLPEATELTKIAVMMAVKVLNTEDAAETELAQALELCERAAEEEGFWLAQFNCGVAYDSGKGCIPDKKKALAYFEKSAEQGCPEAQYNCGIMYRTGEGCEDEIFKEAKALYWYEKAAEQGHVKAMYNCGVMYDSGKGCPKSEKRAFYWYQEAAERGHEDARYNLNIMIKQGHRI